MAPHNERLESALACAVQGLPIVLLFGIIDGICECRAGAACGKNSGKHARFKGWTEEATVDPDQIRRCFCRWPESNIGLATGAASWVVVLDPDGPEGADSLAAYEAENGELPATVAAISGSGRGMHRYFLAPADPAVIGNKVKVLPGLDVRGEGGLIVLPPSRHVSGGRYRWVEGRAPGEIDFAPLPAALLALIRKPEPPAVPRSPTWIDGPRRGGGREDRYALRAVENELQILAKTPEGQRNAQLFRSGCALFRFCPSGRLHSGLVAHDLLDAALHVGLDRPAAERTIRSAARRAGAEL